MRIEFVQDIFPTQLSVYRILQYLNILITFSFFVLSLLPFPRMYRLILKSENGIFIEDEVNDRLVSIVSVENATCNSGWVKGTGKNSKASCILEIISNWFSVNLSSILLKIE